MNGVSFIDTDRLVPHEQVDISKVIQLAYDIKVNGIKLPLAVSYIFDKFVILDGHHRWKAARLLRIKKVPVVIFDFFDPELLVLNYRTKEVMSKESLLEVVGNYKIFPPKSTYFAIRFNGSVIHISEYIRYMISDGMEE
ncbi:MAG: ParB N-terminal domain-containing protein [Nanopusillaceae archaeon]